MKHIPTIPYTELVKRRLTTGKTFSCRDCLYYATKIKTQNYNGALHLCTKHKIVMGSQDPCLQIAYPLEPAAPVFGSFSSSCPHEYHWRFFIPAHIWEKRLLKPKSVAAFVNKQRRKLEKLFGNLD